MSSPNLDQKALDDANLKQKRLRSDMSHYNDKGFKRRPNRDRMLLNSVHIDSNKMQLKDLKSNKLQLLLKDNDRYNSKENIDHDNYLKESQIHCIKEE